MTVVRDLVGDIADPSMRSLGYVDEQAHGVHFGGAVLQVQCQSGSSFGRLTRWLEAWVRQGQCMSPKYRLLMERPLSRTTCGYGERRGCRQRPRSRPQSGCLGRGPPATSSMKAQARSSAWAACSVMGAGTST